MKAGICYAAVYETRELGFWGDSEQSHKLYKRIQNTMEPVCKTVRETVNPPPLPSSGEVGFIANYYYNEGVKGTFRFIKMIPCYIGQGMKKANDALKAATDAKPE